MNNEHIVLACQRSITSRRLQQEHSILSELATLSPSLHLGKTTSPMDSKLSKGKLLALLFLASTMNALALPFNVVDSKLSGLTISEKGKYTCLIESQWTSSRHPNSYPLSTQLTTPVFVVHSSSYHMWGEGSLASEGIESLAETGSIVKVVNELFAVGDQVSDIDLGADMRVQGVELDSSHTFLSVVTKLDPSPDWFTGFYDFSPQENGRWMREFTIESFPFDAGTETGSSYEESGTDQDPPESIQRITNSTVFLNAEGASVLPVAQFKCILRWNQPPTVPPTLAPFASPSNLPTPLSVGTQDPSSPTDALSEMPTVLKTQMPSGIVVVSPTSIPTSNSTGAPVAISVDNTSSPTNKPSLRTSTAPTTSPSLLSSENPSVLLTGSQSSSPSLVPSFVSSPEPSSMGTVATTPKPSSVQSLEPSIQTAAPESSLSPSDASSATPSTQLPTGPTDNSTSTANTNQVAGSTGGESGLGSGIIVVKEPSASAWQNSWVSLAGICLSALML